MYTQTAIDPSMARFVRRAYFKRLTREWGTSDQLLKKAQQLLIKTFGDRSHLLPSQRQAVQEIARIGEGQVGAHILDAMAPGWLNLTRQDINQRLFDAWRHYGWRFDTERLHPGLSNPAWLVH